MRRNHLITLMCFAMLSYSSVSAQSWLLTGNAGTNSSTNFIGTTDNQSFVTRTSNIARLTLTGGTNTGVDNFSTYLLGDWSLPNNPVSLNVYGKDICGFTAPSQIMGSIVGMSWSATGGATNTLGRLTRYSQLTAVNNYQFYDVGIGQDSSYFITERGTSAGGTGFPQRMFVIGRNNNVGVNMTWTQTPTANFHTVGTVRLETLPSGSGNILVIDAAGNVYRSSSTARIANNDPLQKELDEAKKSIKDLKSAFEELKKEIEKLKGQIASTDQPYLKQNFPNPGNASTTIEYYIPENKKGKVIVYDALGKLVKTFDDLPHGVNYLSLDISKYKMGTYLYSLVVNGKKADSKKMTIN